MIDLLGDYLKNDFNSSKSVIQFSTMWNLFKRIYEHCKQKFSWEEYCNHWYGKVLGSKILIIRPQYIERTIECTDQIQEANNSNSFFDSWWQIDW